jgi:hypothetical protein
MDFSMSESIAALVAYLEECLAVSQDERVARAIYAEAARRFPDSKITLAQGAGILEDSFHGTAMPKRVLNAAPGPRLTA